MTACQRHSHESIQAAADAQVNLGNRLVAQITDLLGSFRTTPAQEDQLARLREDKIRLEEQLKSSENIMLEIRETRASANARESHLRNTTDGLLNELQVLRKQPVAIQKPLPHLDERNMISMWQMKYTTLSQQLTSSEERASLRETEVRRGQEEVKKLREQLEKVQAERSTAMRAIDEAKDRRTVDEGEIVELRQKVRAFLDKLSLKKQFRVVWSKLRCPFIFTRRLSYLYMRALYFAKSW